MWTMQQHTTMNHGPLGMNIKSAMAANMGSSLFLFQGLHRISPHLLSTAAEASSPSSRSSSPSPSYFRFELQCTSCRRGECPICLDYNSKIRIGYTVSSRSGGGSRKMTKKQARDSSDGVQILKLDLCSYSRNVTLTRELVSRWIGLSYTEGDAAGSKPKEVDFDGLMRELDSQGVGYSLVSKAEVEDFEDGDCHYDGRASSSWESRTQRLSGSYQRRDYGHGRYGSGSSSSGYYRL